MKWFLLAVGCGLFMVGCRPSNRSISDNYLANRKPVEADANSPAVYSSLNQTGIKLIAEAATQSKGKSVAVSPYGLTSVLSILMNGAEGKTMDSLSSSLHLKEPRTDHLNKAQMALQDNLYRSEETPFVSHNAIFMIWPIMLVPDFRHDMADMYGADIRKVGSAGQGALNEINYWVKEKTKGRIPKILDSLDKDEMIVIANAITLDARWENEFDPSETRNAPFFTAHGEISLPTMSGGAQRGASTDDWTAAALDFRGSSLEAIFVLPNPDENVDALLQGWEADDFAKMQDGLKPSKAQISLPKFKVHQNLDIKPLLEKIGAGGLFRSPNDLRYMSVELQGDYSISQFVQETMAEFDEAGAKAASATATGIKSAAASERIAFDRPFAWFVVEKESGVILLAGTYQGD